MSFTITRDSGRITNASGGVVKIWQVSDSGVPVAPMTVVDLGFIEDTAFHDETESDDIADETLNTVVTLAGERKVSLDGKLLQSGLEMLELVNETRGKFYGCYKKFADLDGNHQEVFMGLTRVVPSIEITGKKPRPPFEIRCAILPSAVTYDSTACGLIGAYATSATIPAGEYYKGVKTAIA